MNVTAVAIVAIACYAVVSIVDTIFKKRDNRAKQGVGKNDMDNTAHNLSSLQEEVNALRSRIETLEKIVTDEKYQLNKEFENLKK